MIFVSEWIHVKKKNCTTFKCEWKNFHVGTKASKLQTFFGVAVLHWEPVITVTKSRTTCETAEKIVFLALTCKIKLRHPDKGWLYLMPGNKTVTRRFVSIGPVTCQDFATYAGAKTLWLRCYLIITESQTELFACSYIMHSTSGLHWPNYFK